MPASSLAESFPAPGMLRSITSFGTVHLDSADRKGRAINYHEGASLGDARGAGLLGLAGHPARFLQTENPADAEAIRQHPESIGEERFLKGHGDLPFECERREQPVNLLDA